MKRRNGIERRKSQEGKGREERVVGERERNEQAANSGVPLIRISGGEGSSGVYDSGNGKGHDTSSDGE